MSETVTRNAQLVLAWVGFSEAPQREEWESTTAVRIHREGVGVPLRGMPIRREPQLCDSSIRGSIRREELPELIRFLLDRMDPGERAELVRLLYMEG